MLRILLVDNGTSHLQEMLDLLADYEVEVVSFWEVSKKQVSGKDAIILSGGHIRGVEHHKDKYQQELALITHTDLPIFGVCLGFELLVVAEGNHLTSLPKKVKGEVEIQLLKPDPIFSDITTQTITASERHRWWVTETKGLEVLWVSTSWVEIIKRPGSLVYGTQFHPEILDHEATGYLLLHNFLQLVEQWNL